MSAKIEDFQDAEAGDAAPKTYFTPEQVRQHMSPDDCWCSWLGSVYDLTPLVKQYKGRSDGAFKGTSFPNMD